MVRTMDVLELILIILLLVAGVVVIAAVLLQQGKAHGLSGAIAGGAETFFGKEKGKRADRLLAKWTSVISGVFVLLVLILYILVPELKASDVHTRDYWAMSPYYSTEVTEILTTDNK